MAHITIIGGHGKVALRLAGQLARGGHAVTSWIRNPGHREDVEHTGASALVADIEGLDVAAITERLPGQDAAVWSAGAGGGSPSRTYAVDRDAAIRSMAAAAQARVRRYVMVSYMYGRPDHGVPKNDPFFPYVDAKAAADTHLASTDLDWTILRPSILTDEPGTGLIETGTDLVERTVSRDDVAAVAAYILDAPQTAGKIIDFNNGETAIADALG